MSEESEHNRAEQMEIGEMTYEEGYSALQEVLQQLEQGDLSLEESLQAYELGTRLATHCTQKLEAAELRVKRWQQGDEAVDFEGWQFDGAA